MSIITEALKKAQKERFDQTTHPERKEDPSPVFVYQGKTVQQVARVDGVIGKKNRHRELRILILGLIVIAGAVVFISSIVWKNDASLQVKHNVPAVVTAELTASPREEEVTSRSRYDAVKSAILQVRSEVPEFEDLPVLNGIMFSAEAPKAILGDEIVSPGSRINGFEVKEISPEKVSLYRSGKNYEVKLK